MSKMRRELEDLSEQELDVIRNTLRDVYSKLPKDGGRMSKTLKKIGGRKTTKKKRKKRR